jgi:hypothetical protein
LIQTGNLILTAGFFLIWRRYSGYTDGKEIGLEFVDNRLYYVPAVVQALQKPFYDSNVLIIQAREKNG